MPEAIWILLLLAFPAVGALTRRWAAALLPLLGWPLFYLGLDRDWWLYGTGDGWEAMAVLFTLLGTATTAWAVAVGRVVLRRPVTRAEGGDVSNV